ncbi:helix-turn-helix domain-containing protein [Ferrimonas gelatinilytica]|uniref:Helix-turn-helix domain-containing protein n=1 Tax=Ferrimonas gelatinilytica TaxID=1255257 RepID=A0ABP9S0T7_9GAMM
MAPRRCTESSLGSNKACHLSVAQLADEWSCNPATISRLVERGELKAFRLGRVLRIPRTSVDAYVQRQAVQ